MAAKPEVLVVTGPTASGKTRLAVELAVRIGAEIINADSVQVYRDFNIGACKPSAEELARVPHHLLSCVDPREDFNAGVFARLAGEKIEEIVSRGSRVIVVGGTGLYIRSLLCGLIEVDDAPEDVVDQVRQRETELTEALADKPNVRRYVSQGLHQWLEEIDPKSASVVERTDTARIKRALMVKLSSGESLVDFHAAHEHQQREYRALVLALLPEREALYRAINRRVKEMCELGLLEEVKGLLATYPKDAKAFGAIGYRQAVQYLQGEINFDRMVETIKRDTRRFAKRQMTWWRNQPSRLGWQRVACEKQFKGSIDDISDDLTKKAVGIFDKFPEFEAEEIAFMQLVDFEAA